MRSCMDSIKGITWERLERDSSVTYPCENEGDPGQPVVFQTHFPTATGRAKFVPADLIGAAERSEEHTSELQSQSNLVCRLLLEKKKIQSARLYRDYELYWTYAVAR